MKYSPIQKIALLACFIGCLALLTPAFAFTPGFSVEVRDWPHAIMGLLGGVSFLLYGLGKITNAFKALAGDKMRLVLHKLTQNPFKGLATGALMTSIIQSSAAVTVMLIGFVSAKLITLSRSLPILIGADIGTTITVQLIAFKLNQYALIFVSVGFIIKSFAPKETIWHLGRSIMALGMIFFGIFVMGESMNLVKNDPILVDAMTHISSPAMGILTGFLATALMQSSAAAIAVVLAFAGQGLIGLESGLYLVMGANVGTCLMAGIASLKSNTDGRRLAIAHLSFKAFTMLTILIVTLVATEPFLNLLLFIFPNSTLETISPHHVAHIHTLFNILVALIFMPILPWVVIALQKGIKRSKESQKLQSRYLDPALINVPTLALNAARMEASRIGHIVAKHIKLTPLIIFESGINDLNRLKDTETRIDALYQKLISYLAQIGQKNISKEESMELAGLLNITNRLENMADLIGDELYELGRRRLERNVHISVHTQEQIHILFNMIESLFKETLYIFEKQKEPYSKIKSDISSEAFQKAVNETLAYQAKRLSAKEDNRINTYALEVEIVDKTHRLFHHTQQIKKTVTQARTPMVE